MTPRSVLNEIESAIPSALEPGELRRGGPELSPRYWDVRRRRGCTYRRVLPDAYLGQAAAARIPVDGSPALMVAPLV